ncbi:hypothetical protein INN71_03075 [Nocardioides sp. ChNu-153]|uniref:hypothetical protein n=1 Tax=unclassified Nocardioides TaxID=2615069 RepID=UPI00240694D6|nr:MULTISPECIES: hypothetical protein [unclassified Nocardioides]MDF9716093.1 hypothetical protein [Nocardioides sp. ChNu-99]MDN7120368.1 hypothetical protein [Nocardioides sp. ChNu-153]
MTHPEQPAHTVLTLRRTVVSVAATLALTILFGTWAVRDEGGARVGAAVVAVLALLLALMFVAGYVRARRVQRNPDSPEARRMRETLAAVPPPPSGPHRWVGLGLSVGFFVLLALRGIDGLSDPLVVTLRVLQVVIFVGMVVFSIRELRRHRRWSREHRTTA